MSNINKLDIGLDNMITICFMNDYGEAVVRTLPAMPARGDVIPLWGSRVYYVKRSVWFPLDVYGKLKEKLDGITPDVVVECTSEYNM